MEEQKTPAAAETEQPAAQNTDPAAAREQPAKKRSGPARFFALAAALVLIALFLATLIAAFVKKPGAADVLSALIYADVVVPVVLYGYFLITKQLRKK